jgi:hypothetical protein
MIPETVHTSDLCSASITDRVLAHDVEAMVDGARVRLRKGHILAPQDIPALRASNREVHLLVIEPGDVHEDEAARRLARAVAGGNIVVGEPHESQIALRAATRGLLSIDIERLLSINCVPEMSVWTLFDAQIVRQGQAIGGVKATPLITRAEHVAEAERIARDGPPVIQVLPFVPRNVGVLVREELLPAAGERFREAITMKVGWFGSTLIDIVHPANNAEAIVTAIRGLCAEGADMILCAGVTSTDPLDLTVQALETLHAQWEKRGVPAHPGSTYWLAYLGDVPVLGMASCGMFSRATVLDLILPRFFAREHVTARTLAALGHGGLLNKAMAFRFPDYASAEIAANDDGE